MTGCTSGQTQCMSSAMLQTCTAGQWVTTSCTPNVCENGSCTQVPTTGVSLWLRADQGTALNSSNALLTWKDQSSNGNDASSSIAPPTWMASVLNGNPVVHFNGVNSFLSVADSSSLDFGTSTDFTIIVVARAMSNSIFSGIIAKANPNTTAPVRGWEVVVHDFSSHFSEQIIAGAANSNSVESSLDIQDDTFRILTTIATRSTLSVTFFENGTSIGGGSASLLSGSMTTTAPLYIGTERMQQSFFSGDLAEILVYSQALSDTDRNAAETYLSDKYKIPTASNPSP